MREIVERPLVISYLAFKSRIGNIWLGATPSGIFRLYFGNLDTEALIDFFRGKGSVRFEVGGPMVEEAARQVLHYLEGKLTKFTLKVDLSAESTFCKRVWRATSKIPYGEVRSYGWLANRLGNPGLARAVGLALSKNPIPIIIPCHRVIGSHGWLGGFSAGLRIKRYLLAIEAGQSVLDFGEPEE